MRCCLSFLLFVIAVPANASQGWTLNGGLSHVDEYGLGADMGLGYFWQYGKWTTRFNFAAGTAVEDDNERYVTETRIILFLVETICRDTETGNQVDRDKCSDSAFLYAPSLEAAYAIGEVTRLGIGYRGIEQESAYAFIETRFGEEQGWYWQIKLGDKYSGINVGWDFGVSSGTSAY